MTRRPGASAVADVEPGVVTTSPNALQPAAPLAAEAAAAQPARGAATPPAAITPPAAPGLPAGVAATPTRAATSTAAPATPADSAAPAIPDGLVRLEEIAPAITAASMSRRRFLGFGLTIVGGLAGAAALSKLIPVFEEPPGPGPIVPAYDPKGKAWTFVVDTASCIGCGLCVVACKEENDVTEEVGYARTWVDRHALTADGATYVDSPKGGIEGFPATSTAPGAQGKTVTSAYFEPRLCMQCENPPCTTVCPVGATYQTEDGVILVDARRCIGCGYCVVACPYGARYLAPAGDDAPNGVVGVADKCTWCYHRISRGQLPACVEVCPVGARKFGDATDPGSEIAVLVRGRSPKPLNPEYGTKPRVLYLGPSVEEA